MLTRRSALKTMGAAAAVTLAAPNIARAKPSQLVVATGGGKLDDAYKASVFKAFTEKTGIQIVTTANPAAKLKAMVEQKAVEWDLMQGPAEDFIVHGRNGLFEPVDYKVVSKSDLIEGAAHEHFVLTDVAMPHEDGHSLLRKLRALPRSGGRDWRIAALTAHASAEDRRRALGAGFDAYLTKPFQPHDLARVLLALAARSK